MADKATAVSFRYGNRGSHQVFRGVKGEITVDTDTPTVWVHTGNPSIPGTPLAREDCRNINTVDLATGEGTTEGHGGKDLLYKDMSNVTITDVEAIRSRLLDLKYAYNDLSNVTSDIIAGKGFALKTLDNVVLSDITKIIGNNTYVKKDLTNISLDELDSKGLAHKDMANVDPASIKNRGIASNTLDNVTISDTTRDVNHLDLQKVSKLVNILTDTILNDGTYPSAYSVKSAIDAIPPMITRIVVDTLTASETLGQITINISKVLEDGKTPTITEINSHLIEGTWRKDSEDPSEKTWIFTPKDSSTGAKIVLGNWVITLI